MATIGIYNPLKKWKKGDFPQTVEVFLVLNQHGKTDDQGAPIIGMGLCSDAEIDFAIDELIGDLEKARVKAKRDLCKQKEKMRG